MSKLFSDDEGSVHGGGVQLTINEHYAKAFEYRKEREELERLKAKYGSDYDPDASDSQFSTDSESAESEDEHGEELTPAVDVAILRTLARIRKKDPAIYDSQKDIFGEEKDKVSSKPTILTKGQPKSKGKSKPVTLRQAALDAMLHPSRSPSPDGDLKEENEQPPLTHVEEQEVLRRETIAAFHDAIPDDENDDFLIPREKTKDEREREEEEYRAFLEREVGDLRELVSVDGSRGDEEEEEEEEEEREQAIKNEVASKDEAAGEETDKKKKKKKKKKKQKEGADNEEGSSGAKRNKTKAEGDQEFLMNYILNRGWIDYSEGHVPTYNEITLPTDADRRKKKGKAKAEPLDNGLEAKAEGLDDEEMDTGLLSDTSFESLASHFEASYNHRFEEPGAATIPSFPRDLPSVVRRQDTTRKDARERRKQRKEEELAKKKEEVKRLKALKMREVKRKLELISRQGGLKKGARGGEGGAAEEEEEDFMEEALKELDLEGEWDPEKHDRQMAHLFERGADAFEDDGGPDEEDYGLDEEDGAKLDANGKPVWDDDIDIGDIPVSDDGGNVVNGSKEKSKKKEKKKEKKKKKKKGGEDEDEGGVDIDAMDADAAPLFGDDEEWDGTEEMRKRKLNEYMDEIYGLDFNDIVGDLPTRFKYVPVQPQTYSLAPAEILMATDQELNEYMTVKRYAPYRQDKGGKQHFSLQKQEKLREIKTKVIERSGGMFGIGAGRGDEAQGEKVKKRKGKKERMKLKAALGDREEGEAPEMDTLQDGLALTAVDGAAAAQKKSKKRKREEHGEDEPTVKSVVDGQSIPHGDISPKKKRKRRHKKKEGEGEASTAQI